MSAMSTVTKVAWNSLFALNGRPRMSNASR
jgi:hypothetical protein